MSPSNDNVCRMWSPGDIASTVLGILGVLGGIFAFFYSRAANKKAAEAQTEAATALRRAADALERANELAEPKAEVKLELGELSENRYAFQNVGQLTVPQAQVVGAGESPDMIDPDETAPRDLTQADSIAFSVRRFWGSPTARVRIQWLDPESGEPDSLEVNLHN
jgi:hypothetical protein